VKDTLSYLADRMTEASSWAGIATALGLLHVNLDPGLFKSITMVGMGLGGILAFFIPGGPAKPK